MIEHEKPASESTNPQPEPAKGTEGTEPRGNPEPDQEAVEESKEGLEKISGN